MTSLIFLSHIHEESRLAQVLQNAIESEFAGFVSVFVSSDRQSIPVGANFLRRIESGLVDCVCSVYLLSPESVGRSWINFELGAVWIRGAMAIRQSQIDIPIIPICHSGMHPTNLPIPLNNLNAVEGGSASALERVFMTVQKSTGGSGPLRTDFDDLARQVIDFEEMYTLGQHALKVLNLLKVDIAEMRHEDAVNSGPPGATLIRKIGFTEKAVIDEVAEINRRNRRLRVKLYPINPTLVMDSDSNGTVTGSELGIEIPLCTIRAALKCGANPSFEKGVPLLARPSI